MVRLKDFAGQGVSARPEMAAHEWQLSGCLISEYILLILASIQAGDSWQRFYDKIGCTYSGRREADPRIAAAIALALDGCASILNVGAGSGSYEPTSKSVVALEPSLAMIAQRPQGAAPVVQGVAESLPFRDQSFDAVLGVLTVHHWKNKEKGFSECRRVARSQVVFLTTDFDVCEQFWLFDYFPELIVDRYIFPRIEQYADFFGSVESISIPIPADCRDGFLCA